MLKSIEVQSVDYFGSKKLGFVKIRADIRNDKDETLPGSVFLRGGSVGMLVSAFNYIKPELYADMETNVEQLVLEPDDTPSSSVEDHERKVILTVQPRVPAGSLAFVELPAGMLDDSGSFAGAAAKEIKEETGLDIQSDELVDMTSLAATKFGPESSEDGEKLQAAVYPSAGGCDEFVPIFYCKKRMSRKRIEELQGSLTGLRGEGEKITLKVVPVKDLWKDGMRDAKSLSAWALYNGLRGEGLL